MDPTPSSSARGARSFVGDDDLRHPSSSTSKQDGEGHAGGWSAWLKGTVQSLSKVAGTVVDKIAPEAGVESRSDVNIDDEIHEQIEDIHELLREYESSKFVGTEGQSRRPKPGGNSRRFELEVQHRLGRLSEVLKHSKARRMSLDGTAVGSIVCSGDEREDYSSMSDASSSSAWSANGPGGGFGQAPGPCRAGSSGGSTLKALFSKVRHGRYKEVIAMFDGGVPADVRDEFGNTALLIAAQNGHKRVVKECLRRGGNINAQNHKGQSVLHFAYGFGYAELGNYLRSKGANDSLKNSAGLTCYEGLSSDQPAKLTAVEAASFKSVTAVRSNSQATVSSNDGNNEAECDSVTPSNANAAACGKNCDTPATVGKKEPSISTEPAIAFENLADADTQSKSAEEICFPQIVDDSQAESTDVGTADFQVSDAGLETIGLPTLRRDPSSFARAEAGLEDGFGSSLVDDEEDIVCQQHIQSHNPAESPAYHSNCDELPQHFGTHGWANVINSPDQESTPQSLGSRRVQPHVGLGMPIFGSFTAPVPVQMEECRQSEQEVELIQAEDSSEMQTHILSGSQTAGSATHSVSSGKELESLDCPESAETGLCGATAIGADHPSDNASVNIECPALQPLSDRSISSAESYDSAETTDSGFSTDTAETVTHSCSTSQKRTVPNVMADSVNSKPRA